MAERIDPIVFYHCPLCYNKIFPHDINHSREIAKCDKCFTKIKAKNLLHHNDLTTIPDPPSKSRIVIKKHSDDSLQLIYPRTFKFKNLIHILLCTGGLVLLMFLTPTVIKTGLIPAIVVEIQGILIVSFYAFYTANRVMEFQTFIFNKEGLLIVKDKAFSKGIIEVPINEIARFGLRTITKGYISAIISRTTNGKLYSSYLEEGNLYLKVIREEGNIPFFEACSEKEKLWAVATLNRTLRKYKENQNSKSN